MLYFILLILGLLIGAVFLVVLLIGDKKEARLEAQKKELQQRITVASEPVEGVWPPPLSAAALPDVSQPVPSTKTTPAPGTSRKMVRAFFHYRSYAAAVLFVSAIVYASYPQFNFGWVLLITTLSAIAVGFVMTKIRKSRQSSRRL